MDHNSEKHTSAYIVIPAKVRFDKTLPAAAKLLYGEIAALCNNEKGYCWANNEYFMDLFDCGASTVSRWITMLAAAGYITVSLIRDEKDVITGRRIYIAIKTEMPEIPQQETMTITITKPAGGGVLKNENTYSQKREHVFSKMRTRTLKNEKGGVLKNENTLNRISNYNIYNNKSLLLSNNNNARVRVTAEEFDDYFSIPKAACCFQCADGYSIVREYLLKEINTDRLSLGEISGEDICNYVQSLYTVDYKRRRYRRKHITDLDAYLRGVKNTMETEV